MDISRAVDRCMTFALDSNKSPHTVRIYRRALDLFLSMLRDQKIKPDESIQRITMEQFIDFPSWLNRQGFSRQTLAAYMAGSRFFLDWMILEHLIEPTYAETTRYGMAMRMVNKKRESRLPREPKQGYLEKMIEAVYLLPEPSPRKERNIALILLLATSGCRNEEASRLKIGDIDLVDGSARIIGKGNKERMIFFSQSTAEAMKTYWKARGGAAPHQYAFWRHDRAESEKTHQSHVNTNTIRNIVDDVAAIAGIPKGQFTPHYFRHAFATRMLEQTGNLVLVKGLLGHASVTTTERYTHEAQRDLQEAHRRAFPS